MKRSMRALERCIYLVTKQSGDVAYWVQVYQGGRAAQKTCATREEARQLRDQWDREGIPLASPKGDKPKDLPPPAEPTIEDALRDYSATLAKQGALPGSKRVLEMLPAYKRQPALDAFLARPLSTLDEQTILDWIEDRRTSPATRGPRVGQPPHDNTLRKEWSIMRLAFAQACPTFVPPKLGKALPEVITEREMLTEDQREALFAALDEPFQTVARLAYRVGLRREECAAIAKAHIRVDQGKLRLPQTKTGPDQVSLGTEAIKLIRSQLARTAHLDTPWLFPNPQHPERHYSAHHIFEVLKVAARSLGLDAYRFHDLRHQFASDAIANGATTQQVMKAGRWRSTRHLERRYAHMLAGDVRALQDSLTKPRHPVRRLSIVGRGAGRAS